MGMIQALRVINQMEADGIIGRYAIAGAFAAFYYLEPALTEDIDILVSFEGEAGQRKPGLIALDPIFSYLRKKGYSEFRKEGIVIEGWPAQFIPVADSLDAEALAQSRDVEIVETSASLHTRIPSPEHLVAISLRVGRAKDFIRITQFLDGNVLDIPHLCAILDRHGLAEAWRSFCFRNGIANPCALYSKP
jgi:hypothetical protein